MNLIFKRERNEVIVIDGDTVKARYDHEQWASIVSSVSVSGDTPEAHQTALQFFLNGVDNLKANQIIDNLLKARLDKLEKVKAKNKEEIPKKNIDEK